MLNIRALHVALGGRVILDDFDLDVAGGEWIALLGSNGSGKSTLLRTIAGLLPIASGQISIDGADLESAPVVARRGFGYAVPEGELPMELTGYQYLDVLAQVRRVPPDEALAQLAWLSMKEALSRPIAGYSLGMRQKLSIVGATLGEPGLWLLDESLNGLDPIASWLTRHWLDNVIASGRVAIVMAVHDLAPVYRHCSRAVLLQDGRIGGSWNLAARRQEDDANGQAVFERDVIAAMNGGEIDLF